MSADAPSRDGQLDFTAIDPTFDAGPTSFRLPNVRISCERRLATLMRHIMYLHYLGEDQCCYISNAGLAKKLEKQGLKHESSVRDLLAILKSCNLVRVEVDKGNDRTIIPLVTFEQLAWVWGRFRQAAQDLLPDGFCEAVKARKKQIERAAVAALKASMAASAGLKEVLAEKAVQAAREALSALNSAFRAADSEPLPESEKSASSAKILPQKPRVRRAEIRAASPSYPYRNEGRKSEEATLVPRPAQQAQKAPLTPEQQAVVASFLTEKVSPESAERFVRTYRLSACETAIEVLAFEREQGKTKHNPGGWTCWFLESYTNGKDVLPDGYCKAKGWTASIGSERQNDRQRQAEKHLVEATPAAVKAPAGPELSFPNKGLGGTCPPTSQAEKHDDMTAVSADVSAAPAAPDLLDQVTPETLQQLTQSVIAELTNKYSSPSHKAVREAIQRRGLEHLQVKSGVRRAIALLKGEAQ